MDVFFAVMSAVAAVVISLSLVYFLGAMGAGVHEVTASKARLAVQGAARYENPFIGSPNSFDVYFLVPCLNEEAVIGSAVAALAGNTRSTVIVIDDASDDATAQIAARHGASNTIVLSRTLPNARTGKGEALNDAYELVRRLVAEREQDPSRVLVCVMDADGRLSDGALAHILPIFENPRVGGLQLAVRIRNRQKNFLTRFQDFQFWAMSAVTQFGRRKTGTVSLGGNGQFTRMSALEQLEGMPWSASLTEDLDLAISLLSRGWSLETTPFASVDQQGVESLKRLIIQRRRWYQGHMTAGGRIFTIWRNPALSNARALEISAYLIVPWLFDLPWSILFHWTLFITIVRAPNMFSFVSSSSMLLVALCLWYLLTFAPAIFTTVVYLRRDQRVGWGWAITMGHAFLVMNYLSFTCAWGALYRMIRGKTGWDKTKRVAEPFVGAANEEPNT